MQCILNLPYYRKFCQWQIRHQALTWTNAIVKIMTFLIFMSLYNTQNGLYIGYILGYITLRGNANENFHSYGSDKQNSKILFCTTKQSLPNIFQCTAFKKHSAFLMSQNQENLNIFASTLDRKDDIQQYNNYVNLHPVDVSYE